MIPGVLKVYRGQNEMIICIMMNYIATLFMGVLFTNWLRDGSVPQTIAVPDGTRLTRLFGLRATSAFIIAIAVGLIVYYFLFNTSKGFQLRAVGFNMTAAKFNGFAVEKYFLFSFLISGMIAGLGGSAEILGTQFFLINGYAAGYGFDGVSMALIGQHSYHACSDILRCPPCRLNHYAGGYWRAYQRIRYNTGAGDSVYRGGPCPGKAA